MVRRWKYLIGCAIVGALFLLQAQFQPPNSGGGGSGTVTSVIVASTANQITVSGTCTITTTGTCTLSLPASISSVTNLTPGADFTVTQNSVVPFTSVSSGAVANTVYLTAGHALLNTTTDLGAILTVADTRSTSPRGILSLQNSTDTNGARVGFAKSRGTAASPTIVVTGDTLGRSMYRGYDGSNYLEMASIEAVATGTIAVTRVPTYFAFSTATDATPSVLTEALRINPTQNVLIGGTTEQNYKLSVEKSGTTGTANFQDLTATTGATRVNIGLGAADSASTVTFTNAGSQTNAGSVTTTNLIFNADSNLSRIGAGIMALGNGTAGNAAGLLRLSGISIGAQATAGSANQLRLYDNAGVFSGIVYSSSGAGLVGLSSTGNLQFYSGDITTSPDSSVSRVSAGVIGIGTGAQGSVAGTVSLNTIIIAASSFSFNGHTCTIVSTVVTCP